MSGWRLRPNEPTQDKQDEPPLVVRLFWFLVLMLGGLLTVAAAAYVLRTLLFIG